MHNAQNLTKFCIHIKASDKWLSKYELEKLHLNHAALWQEQELSTEDGWLS